MKFRSVMIPLLLLTSVWILSWNAGVRDVVVPRKNELISPAVKLGALDRTEQKTGAFKKTALNPGVYIEEVPSINNLSITGVDTSTAGFLGQTEKGPLEPTLVTSVQEFENLYGGNPQGSLLLPYAVKGFFDNGGSRLYIARVTLGAKNLDSKAIRSMKRPALQPVLSDYIGRVGADTASSTGLSALGLIDGISILYAPEAQSVPGLVEAMIEQCEALKDRVVILEPALGDTHPEPLEDYDSRYAAYYAPWVRITDDQGKSRLVPPGGFIAGTYSKVDRTRGVHKTPANIPLVGVTGLERALGKTEQDNLYMNMVNPIISQYGRDIVAYGGRSLTDDLEYRYICVTRYEAYVRESLLESLAPLVFEEWNASVLTIAKLACQDFLIREWQKGALLGNKASEAFFVQISPYGDTSLDILTGLALMKPAEFFITGVTLEKQ